MVAARTATTPRQVSGSPPLPPSSDTDAVRPRTTAEARRQDHVRRQFFAHAGALAQRYRIHPSRVLEHAEVARRALPGRLASNAVWIEDLVLAAACSDGVEIAWADLTHHVGPSLHRAASRRLSAAAATAFVPRFWKALRQETLRPMATPQRGAAPSLRTFAGQRSLESWLVERMLSEFDRATERSEPSQASSRTVGV